MKVDITIDDSTDTEYSSAYYGIEFTDWVHQKRRQLPYLTELVLLLKKLLSLHELNIPYYGILVVLFVGGLSSYVLILMVSSFLKICKGCNTIGHSFLEILRYYAYDFNYQRMYINRGEFIVLMSEEYPMLENFVVIDPFRMELNAARNLTRLEDIKDLFRNSYELIMNYIEKYEAGEDVNEILAKLYQKEESNSV